MNVSVSRLKQSDDSFEPLYADLTPLNELFLVMRKYKFIQLLNTNNKGTEYNGCKPWVFFVQDRKEFESRAISRLLNVANTHPDDEYNRLLINQTDTTQRMLSLINLPSIIGGGFGFHNKTKIIPHFQHIRIYQLSSVKEYTLYTTFM